MTPHAARHAAEKDNTRRWFCGIVQGLKLKYMQSPQEAVSCPAKNRVHASAKEVTTRPPRRQYLRRHSPARLQTYRFWSFKGQDKSSQFQAGCMCTNSPRFASASHAPAIASCGALPVSHNARQPSCEAGTATKPKSLSLQSLDVQTLSKRLSPVPIWQEIPFASLIWEFPSAVRSLKEQSLTPVRGSHCPSTCCDTPTTSHSTVTCPAQSHLPTSPSHCFSC